MADHLLQFSDCIILDHLLEALIITDSDLTIIYVNKVYCELTGYQSAEVIGKNAEFLISDMQGTASSDISLSELAVQGTREHQVWCRKKNSLSVPVRLKVVADRILAYGPELRYLIGFTEIALQRISEEQLRFHQRHDELTGLFNRKYFLAQVELGMNRYSIRSVKKTQGICALTVLDLDRFKYVSDHYGSAVGDEVIRQYAARLRDHMGTEDLVGRLGGDAFALFLQRADVYEVDMALRHIQDQIRQPIIVGDFEFYITASMGVSLCKTSDRDDPDFLLQRAYAAMYAARERGGDVYEFYRSDMQNLSLQRFELESNLRRALALDEFLLYFQPQLSLQTGGIAAIEVLLRWNQKGQGVILPSVFIPMAEETGLIVEIGQWVLYSACVKARMWMEQGFEFERIAVNLSARQFEQGDLADMVTDILAKTKLPPTRLELEITESTAMADVEYASLVLQEITALGVTVSIDDFGTGYSSLGTLRKLPISILKVDRSFIQEVPRNPDSVAITEAMITMAHSLNMRVIAEGVESQAQVEFLRKCHCDVIQGYFFCYPMAAEALEEWWQNRR